MTIPKKTTNDLAISVGRLYSFLESLSSSDLNNLSFGQLLNTAIKEIEEDHTETFFDDNGEEVEIERISRISFLEKLIEEATSTATTIAALPFEDDGLALPEVDNEENPFIDGDYEV